MKRLFTTPYSVIGDEVTGTDPDTGDDVVEPLEETNQRFCYFEQTASSETNTDREQLAVEAFAVFPAGDEISETTELRISGDVWSVVGRPNQVLRRGCVHHVEAQLRLVT